MYNGLCEGQFVCMSPQIPKFTGAQYLSKLDVIGYGIALWYLRNGGWWGMSLFMAAHRTVQPEQLTKKRHFQISRFLDRASKDKEGSVRL